MARSVRARARDRHGRAASPGDARGSAETRRTRLSERMMTRGRSVGILLLVVFVGISAKPAAAASDAVSPPQQREIITKYCVTCHNQRARTAGLALDTILSEAVVASGEIWEGVIRKL